MKYYILLSIFTQDIVYYIVQIINRANSKNTIYKYYQNTKKKLESIKYISDIITSVNYTEYLDNEILTDKLLNSISIIYNSNYKRVNYNNDFWICFTDLLSKKLMILNNHILIRNKNKKNDTQYIILNNSIRLWFKICVKHNIRISLSFSKVEHYVYCFTREIKEIKNFLKFLYPPRSVDNNNLFLNDDYSRSIVTYTINYNKKKYIY
jgi:hypothetical protein